MVATLRRRVTAGDVTRKLALAVEVKGHTLISINWKKLKAKVLTKGGIDYISLINN